MNIDTVIRLLDAGFTRSEIMQMQGGADPAPAVEPETPAAEPETPAAEPETPAAEPETPADNSGEFAALRQELETLRTTLHNLNVMHSGGGAPPKDIVTEIAEQWSADPYPHTEKK